jgi:hypothetical protein
MKRTLVLISLTLILRPSTPTMGAQFTNFNFESANLPFIPRGEFGDYQPISLAMPGWQAFAGTNPLPDILHNDLTLGTAAISIFGPDWDGAAYEGQYDIFLRPGAFGFPGTSVDMSILQTGLIPAGAQSLRFLGAVASITPTTQLRFGVLVNDQLLDTVVLESGPEYSTFGVDVSAYSGQESTLKITAFSIPGVFNGLAVDAFSFSPEAVPEPGTWALLGLGLVALACRLKRQRHRKP